MLSSKYIQDERFKDTIKKNSCRLRQKSSLQIGVFIKPQKKENSKSKEEKENKELLDKNKTIERNKTPKIKNILNFIKSRKDIQQNYETLEGKQQITVKKKVNEEYSKSIKQRLLIKLKEQRFEKLNKFVKSENNDEINYTTAEKAVSTEIINSQKKTMGSADIKNVIYRNRKSFKNISITINKEENNGSKSNNINNIINNTMNISKNLNKNNTVRRGVFSLKNITSKYYNNNYLEEKSQINYKLDKTFKKENKIKFNSIKIISNKNINENLKENLDNKNEINDSLLITNNKKTRIKYFSYNSEHYKKANHDNYYINKGIIKENKANKDNTNYSNNILINKRIRNNKEVDNNNIIIVHKKESYFNKRYKNKFIKKEEEKVQNSNDVLKQNNLLNNTNLKTEKKRTNYKEIISKRFSEIHSTKKDKENHISLKVSSKNFSSELEREYNLANLEEKNSHKNYSLNYVSTGKQKSFSRCIFFKNLLINTNDNYGFESFKNDEEKKSNINSIIRNNSKYDIKDIKEKYNYININNLSYINNINNFQKKSISDLLSGKKKNFEKDIKTKNISNYKENNYDYVIKMINEAIQLKNAIEIQSLFSILILNFNNKYFSSFDGKECPTNIPQFSDCYKYYSIITIPLIFLQKDERIYKHSSSEAKKIFENFIYITIEILGQKNMTFKKINTFIDEYNKNNNNKEKKSMEGYCSELINSIFKNYKEYSPLKKASEQLLTLAKNESLDKVINRINDTILYCYNHKQKNSFYLLDKKFTGNKNKSFYKFNQLSEKNLNKINSTPKIPFIRTAMKKNFCLVLDIDETIAHTLNLPFGHYFLLRPGVINFLDELSKLYEIIIFTCSPKNYADNILNKIDIDNIFISHRLYKDHVIFEKGKSVKKLNMIGRDLNKIIFVDNMKSNAKYNIQNLCHVSTWIYDINDEEIIKLKVKLKDIATDIKYKDDIRKGLDYRS